MWLAERQPLSRTRIGHGISHLTRLDHAARAATGKHEGRASKITAVAEVLETSPAVSFLPAVGSPRETVDFLYGDAKQAVPRNATTVALIVHAFIASNRPRAGAR
jgi:hypothetical protein